MATMHHIITLIFFFFFITDVLLLNNIPLHAFPQCSQPAVFIFISFYDTWLLFLLPNVATVCLHFQIPTVPSCHGDARHRQLSSDGADAAVWGPHGHHQRGPWYRCQLSPVRAGRLCLTRPCPVSLVANTWASPCCAFRVIIHIVSKCHEEGLEHYLRSFIKVTCTASRKSAAAYLFFFPFCFVVLIRFIVNPSCVFTPLYSFLFCSTCLWTQTLRQGPQPPPTRC